MPRKRIRGLTPLHPPASIQEESARPSYDRFRKAVSQQAITLPDLPLTHGTDAYRFDGIYEADAIEPKFCSVMGEKLVYLFYGRPSYRVHGSDSSPIQDAYLPVCIILKPEAQIEIRRVFPFDSGAYQAGFYAPSLHKEMQLGDFELDPSRDSPGRLISLFFGSAEGYLAGQSGITTQIDGRQFEALVYRDLVSGRLSNEADDRAYAIELQTQTRVVLSEAVEAIVMPQTFLRSPGVREELARRRIEPLAYFQTRGMRKGEIVGTVFDQVYRHYQDRQILPQT